MLKAPKLQPIYLGWSLKVESSKAVVPDWQYILGEPGEAPNRCWSLA